MNLPKLKGKMRERNKTYKQCASVLGISMTGFFNKISGKSPFNIVELDRLGDFLNMTVEERAEIFLH